MVLKGCKKISEVSSLLNVQGKMPILLTFENFCQRLARVLPLNSRVPDSCGQQRVGSPLNSAPHPHQCVRQRALVEFFHRRLVHQNCPRTAAATATQEEENELQKKTCQSIRSHASATHIADESVRVSWEHDSLCFETKLMWRRTPM